LRLNRTFQWGFCYYRTMSVIVGIDEVGRGCWAGPLVAAAVILHKPIKGLKDSKLLSRKQREILSQKIYANASVGIGWVDAATIDRIGLTAATSKAMDAAVKQLKIPYDEIIMDGHFNFLPARQITTIIKADRTIPSVSAASIIAKVARDDYMYKIAANFPAYKFDQHVGYGTKLHTEMLTLYGLCELHRKSFKPIRQLLADSL
jgi:ribonuclease HII